MNQEQDPSMSATESEPDIYEWSTTLGNGTDSPGWIKAKGRLRNVEDLEQLRKRMIDMALDAIIRFDQKHGTDHARMGVNRCLTK